MFPRCLVLLPHPCTYFPVMWSSLLRMPSLPQLLLSFSSVPLDVPLSRANVVSHDHFYFLLSSALCQQPGEEVAPMAPQSCFQLLLQASRHLFAWVPIEAIGMSHLSRGTECYTKWVIPPRPYSPAVRQGDSLSNPTVSQQLPLMTEGW